MVVLITIVNLIANIILIAIAVATTILTLFLLLVAIIISGSTVRWLVGLSFFLVFSS